MNFGLSPNDFETLQKKVFIPLKNAGFQIYVFGSRATGNHHPFSDIDLLLEPMKHANHKALSLIKEDIEEARFPIKVDFVLAADLAESYSTRVNQEKILV